MREHRDELVAMAISSMRKASPTRTTEDLADHVGALVDGIIRHLDQASQGDEHTPPELNEAAARLADDRLRRAYPISELALHIGAISDVLGSLGVHHSMSFAGHEYQAFDHAIDAAMSTAVEEYWNRAREAERHDASEREGFMAHELRNALGTARLAFNMLKRGRIGFGGSTADVLDRALTRLERLVDQALVEARLRARIAPQRVSVPVQTLLRELAAAQLPERGIAISVSAEHGLELVTDERLLAFAISNLLQNAMKFSCEAGRIEVRGRRARDALVIEVEDACGGLPPGKAEALFEPRAQASKDRRGYGLGLAIAREAAGAIGGEIFVRDLPGKGCIFGIRFPDRDGR